MKCFLRLCLEKPSRGQSPGKCLYGVVWLYYDHEKSFGECFCLTSCWINSEKRAVHPVRPLFEHFFCSTLNLQVLKAAFKVYIHL